MLGAFACLAALSLAQGVVDIVVPAVRGEEPFGFLLALHAAFGPAALGAYVYLHNLGLACLVPGFGFLAARFEKKTVNRGHIGLLLAGSVVLSLLVALQYLVQARERFDLALALPLWAAEAVAILPLALCAARELRGFVPTRTYEWSLVTPFRRLRVPLAWSALSLLALSAAETYYMMA